MDESQVSDPQPAGSDVVDGNGPAGPDHRHRVRTAIWAVLSLAFVAFLAFGSVGARIWRFGQLEVESKSILRIWQVQGRNLPDVANGWLLQVLFHGSAIVFVGCVVLGMRYLLLEAGEESPAAPERW
ncbi:MAG: hypothetical protein M3457_16905 [Chloroflexota bacterium]|nr:hypothetical protein [Chloroflexota bacterium]